MQLHTGETLLGLQPDWDVKSREKLGQQYLRSLAEIVLNRPSDDSYYWTKVGEKALLELRRKFELDGYVYRDGELLFPESDVLDVGAEHGILQQLYSSLQLAQRELAMQFLKLSEEHYVDSRWEDSISNSRKFFELTLEECAGRHCRAISGIGLANDVVGKPVRIRDYLERENVLEKKERELLDKAYGLLSHTGAHPYMASNDQARLLRQLALTITQFVMLRTEGSLPPST